MKRADKITNVERMSETFSGKPHIIVTTFNGLSVNQANALRRKIGGIGGDYRVIKNRLAKRAAAGSAAEPMAARFEGPCAIATHDSDPIALAKTLAEFAKENPQVELLAGLVDAKDVVDAEGIKALATTPALPQLRAQLLALISTPATMLARLLSTPASQLARVVDAHRQAQEEK